MLLLEVHAAVDVDLGAGDVIALGHQEAAEALHLLRQVRHHLRRDEPGAHRVHGDVEPRQLLRRRLCETDHPRLGGGVVRLAQVAHLTDDGRHVYDAPAAALYHVRQRRVRAVEYAAQVGRDHLLPLLDTHPADGTVAVDAGVVDQDVDAAELLDRGVDHALDVIRVGDSRLNSDRLLPLVLELCQQLLRLLLALEVVDHDLAAVVRQLAHDGAAEPAGATGDDGDLIVVQTGHRLTSLWLFRSSCRPLGLQLRLPIAPTPRSARGSLRTPRA